MNKYIIVFSPKALRRLENITDYLYEQNLSKSFVNEYIERFENYLNSILGQFPDCGTPMPQYGKNIRRIVYQHYSFLYRVKNNTIEILTICRENLP